MRSSTERVAWDELADLVYELLQSIRLQREELKPEIRKRGINMDQLTASAIIGAIRERIEQTNRAD